MSTAFFVKWFMAAVVVLIVVMILLMLITPFLGSGKRD